MEFKDLSPEDQQAILQRIERARKEAPQLMREGRYADAFDLVYFSALIDPECMRIAMDITLQKEGIHLLRPEQIELLRQHADEKRPLAQYLYGYWLWYNHETPADMDTVVDLMTAASNWGIGNASLVLSLIYKSGELARVEKEESEEYYKKAGKQQLNQMWFRSAIEDRIYGRRGQQADPQTTIIVLRDIIGLPKDTDLRWQTEREKELESEAARQAPPFLWQLLYECHDELGIAWAGEIYAQMAVKQGIYSAWLDLIRCRCTDYKDPDCKILDSKRDEYLRLLHEGAEAGSSEMMYRLGFQLTQEYNEEDTTDERRAELEPEIHKWWERASQLGSGDATQAIAFAYLNGQYGYERNNLEAWKHLNKSAMQGNNDAYYYLATLAYLAWDESIADEEREFRLPPDVSHLTASEWNTLGHIIYEANDKTWPDDVEE